MKNKKEKLYAVSFSGGRTSAFLAKYIKENPKYDNVIFVFMNTGKEKEQTLEFVERCDKEFNLNLIWLEAVVNMEKGMGIRHKIVNFKTASRNGEPFEQLVKKYGIPNTFASICSSRLKQEPLKNYLRDNYQDFEIWTIIGIRFDEAHRKSLNAEKERIIYPLCDEIKVDSRFIRSWWERQPFDLQLKDYEGNCDLCFKKSLKKRLTILKENPKAGEWWDDMEKRYGSESYPRFDLRTNKTIKEQIELSKHPFTKAQDLHDLNKQQCDLFDYETDCMCKMN